MKTLSIKAEVLVTISNKIDNLSQDDRNIIESKFNESLEEIVLDRIDTSSKPMLSSIRKIFQKLDYAKYEKKSLYFTIKEILNGIDDRKLAKEINIIKKRLSKLPHEKINDLLYLNKPIGENPLLISEISHSHVIEYAKLAKISGNSLEKLANKKLLLQSITEFDLKKLQQKKVINKNQKNSLRLIISISKLTGNIFPLTKFISSKIKSTLELVNYDVKDWRDLLVKNKIPLPAKETPDTYSEKIFGNIEKKYPTQFLLNRLFNNDSKPTLKILNSLDSLLKDNVKLIERKTPVLIKFDGINPNDRKKLKQNLNDITLFANSFHHLGISEIINNKKIQPNKKKIEIDSRIKSLETFYKNNSSIDLRFVDFFKKNNRDLTWKNISKKHKSLVRKQLMAFQRVLTLTENTSVTIKFLQKGYDSAFSIMGKPTEELKNDFELQERDVMAIQQRARDTQTHLNNLAELMRESTGDFADMESTANLDTNLVNDLLQIDGYEELFGTQNYCACKECMSILSPSAYFVDMMNFIDKKISFPAFIDRGYTHHHPLFLKNRRDDLWKLKLTCENTNTEVPYLTIVNEVLENYLGKIIDGNIFETLSDEATDISFSLPFNLPLKELQIYLNHFQISLYDIYKLLEPLQLKIWRSRLNLSTSEYNVITLSSAPDYNVTRRIGDTDLSNFDVQDFLNYVGITRKQLTELFAINFYPAFKFIEIRKTTVPDDILYIHEKIYGLTRSTLDHIHRFIRLLKKTSWSIPELDLILTSMKTKGEGDDLDDDVVLYLAKLTEVQDKLNLSIEDLAAMFHDLPTSNTFPILSVKQEDKKLFEHLFDLEKLFGTRDVGGNKEIQDTMNFHHYSFNVDPNDTTVSEEMSLLLGGLGISETELLLLFDSLKDMIDFDEHDDGEYNGDCTLNRTKISILYRYIRLAKTFGFTIEDFIKVLSLNGFSDNSIVAEPDDILKIIKFKDWLKKSSLSISELLFVLHGKQSSTTKFRANTKTIGDLILEVQKSNDMTIEILQGQISQFLGISSDKLTILLNTWINAEINHDDIITALNTDFTNSVPDSPEELLPLINLIQELERTLFFFDKMKFSDQTISKITQHTAIFDIADLKNLTIDNIHSLDIFKIHVASDENAELLVWSILNSYDKDDLPSFETNMLSQLWQQDIRLITSLVDILPEISSAILAIEKLWDCLGICKKLGVNGHSLKMLADDTNYAELVSAKNVAIGAFNSKYEDEKTRTEKLTPYQDEINVIKRDALVDYVIARKQDLKFKTLDDIYAYFLLDIKRGSCSRTSRVVAANSSLQLYVHRCLINLEQSDPILNPAIPNVSVDPQIIPTEEWEWRKNYRVWEANRKVFLYPENYTEPSLRDNKSPQFKELEETLLQQKITKESAEDAYKKYLSQFMELAHLKITGSYYHDESSTYYFFARGQQEPPQYYHRKLKNSTWTPWEKIDLPIIQEQDPIINHSGAVPFVENDDRVSALIFMGKLYLFWTYITINEVTKIKDATSITEYFHKKELNYSFLNENNQWASPQKLSFGEIQNDTKYILNNILLPQSDENNIYVVNKGNNFHGSEPHHRRGFRVDFFRNELVGLGLFQPSNQPILQKNQNYIKLGMLPNDPNYYGRTTVGLYRRTTGNGDNLAPRREIMYHTNSIFDISDSDIYEDPLISHFDYEKFKPELRPIDHSLGRDFLLTLGNQQLMIQNCDQPQQNTIRLTTSLTEEFAEILFNRGLEEFLSLYTQKRIEHPLDVNFTDPQLDGPEPDVEEEKQVIRKFSDAHGLYFREIFFHIPFLIANHLNANQRFQEAKWWYERIFDPTSNESPTTNDPPNDRNWKYIEFRGQNIEKMKEILLDPDAIGAYKTDPFNPHAIARLRLSAYQKTIVMKYIDNLLDWGDYLFSQDTRESINEATMLYVLASDILGNRPLELGECEHINEEQLTFDYITRLLNDQSEFLITLENLLSVRPAEPMTPSTGVLDAYVGRINRVTGEMVGDPADEINYNALAFCVPPNKDFLKYWNRVEDRLFKIRNCMNISGVRRQLSLFQPPIDPRLLVKAKASGLSLDDVLGNRSESLYRFTYLIGKAKEFTQTVQNFGSKLSAALEKKDIEELTRLRSVHERNILQMTKDVKEDQIKEVEKNYQMIVETQTNIQNRIDYYSDLIEGGLLNWEKVQQLSKVYALGLQLPLGSFQLMSAIMHLVPEVGAPTAMKFGGVQIASSLSSFAGLTSTFASIANMISDSAGLESTFQRREAEWKNQLKLSEQEFKQVEQQKLATEIRKAITEHELEIHKQNMEQVDELEDFYKNKFTNLAHYDHLSRTLSKLYRNAYNTAFELSTMAENAYQFERDDKSAFFLKPDNWQVIHAGLLSGEQLLLQLEHMEKTYIEKNKRDYEITQSFSLSMLNPSALFKLKQTGSCEFKIPEIIFDMTYPGQYKRLIKSVRLTIPCVTGPYTNVGAKLTLQKSQVRREPSDDPLEEISKRNSTSIFTSTAQNDGGVFEINFRDERYMPFEGVGAISDWMLELPSKLRSFDYDTISDIMIHISYTAIDDGNFRKTVENKIAASLIAHASKDEPDGGLYRLISLKHEFPNQFHELLNPLGDTQQTSITLTKKHFPYFLSEKNLTLSAVNAYLLPKSNTTPIDTVGLALKIKNKDAGAWSDLYPEFPVQESVFPTEDDLAGDPIGDWSINAGDNGLNKDDLDDLLILLKYKI